MGKIEIGDFIVEWDDNKAELNWKKHRIHFEDAARVFLDENRIDEFDEEHSDYETDYKKSSEIRKRFAGSLKVENDANKLFGNVGERNKVMFSFVALFLQIGGKSL